MGLGTLYKELKVLYNTQNFTRIVNRISAITPQCFEKIERMRQQNSVLSYNCEPNEQFLLKLLQDFCPARL